MKLKLSAFIFMIIIFFASCKSDNQDISAPALTTESQLKTEYAQKVKKEFQHAWQGYKKYAWGHDALKPLTKTHRDWYAHSLLFTPVDAYDTMLLMDLDDEAKECKQLILDSLSFDYDMEVQVFEITIRVLGGLISAYQMDGDPKFLSIAKDLGDRLMPAFDTPTGMPNRMVNLRTGASRDHLNNPAEVGTLQLEFMMLSHLTNDKKYEVAALKAMDVLWDKRSGLDLVGTVIDVNTGVWTNEESHISGMIDSYYEYLIKIGKLFDRPKFVERYNKSITGINKYLLDELPNGKWYGRCDMNTGARTGTYFGALDAFMPAMLALGGDVGLAKEIQESCYKLWMIEGIEPEMYDYSNDSITNGFYVLRPENIESAAYLYHHTGDIKYLNMGKSMFDSIVKHCKTDEAYAEIKDVRTMEKQDGMESFFLAETLKYAYLLFSDQKHIDFKNTIFNTEAHPFTYKIN